MTQETILPLAPSTGTPKQIPLTQVPLALAIVLALGVIILIWSEIWVIASVLFWAIAGVVQLSGGPAIILAILIFAPAVWASWMIAKLAIEAERTPEDIGDPGNSPNVV